MTIKNRLQINIDFPLDDGRTLVAGPLTYNQDGLATVHNSDFVADPAFLAAYEVGMQNSSPSTRIEWRVHVAIWCASQCFFLEGDFVECGVHTGILSGAILEYLKFSEAKDRKFYLFDTWNGIPIDQMSDSERNFGLTNMNRKYQNGDTVYELAKAKFAKWPNVELIRGQVPETLSNLNAKKIAFLSIDLNVAAAEIGAIEILWPRLASGAYVLLDDYGWAAHIHQKLAWDDWAKNQGIMILSLPTGQAIIRKP